MMKRYNITSEVIPGTDTWAESSRIKIDEADNGEWVRIEDVNAERDVTGKNPDKMSARELRNEVRSLRRLKGHVELLRQVLEMARKKLELYRDFSDGKYRGGIEHTTLIGNIKRTLTATKP